MGIRETLNRNPTLTTALTGGIVVLAIIVIFWQGCDRGSSSSSVTKYYFTTDDGKNYFPDDSQKIPPFQVDGKPAVRAAVFKCGDGAPFVGYLERYTPETQKTIADARAKSIGSAQVGPIFMMTGREVKKPNDKTWTPTTGSQHIRIISPQCPQGSTGDPVEIFPK